MIRVALGRTQLGVTLTLKDESVLTRGFDDF